MTFLLEGGFNVNLRDTKTLETAIVRAVHFNHVEIVRLLLQYNPDLTMSHKEMRIKPLFIAVFRCKPLLVDLLMEHGETFNLNAYLKSKANKMCNWSAVSVETKRVILRHMGKYI